MSCNNKRLKLSPQDGGVDVEPQPTSERVKQQQGDDVMISKTQHDQEDGDVEEEVVEVIKEKEMEQRAEVRDVEVAEQQEYRDAQVDEEVDAEIEEEIEEIEEETTECEKEEIEDDNEEEGQEQDKSGQDKAEVEDAEEAMYGMEDAEKEEEETEEEEVEEMEDTREGTDKKDGGEAKEDKIEDLRDNANLADEYEDPDGARNEDGNDEANNARNEDVNDDDKADNGKQQYQNNYTDPNDMDHRRKLAALMFSSLQSLMGMELCKDTTPPLEEISTENSTILPLALLKLMLLAVTSLMQEEGRQCWKLEQSRSEWTGIERGVGSIDATTRDALWRRKYSMSYACFLYVVEELRPFIQSESKIHVRAPIEIERAVAMVLYRLAHGLSAHEVAEKYNVGASTVGKYTLIVASALADANKLYGQYMATPTGNRMARIISQFQQITNIPNICGAIDGTHIKLYFKPDKWYTPSAYRSPYKFHSILLQAVCDPNKLFWDVCCMAPGGTHDASHFMTSYLYQKVKEGICLQEPVITAEGREIPPFMVGDNAYPIRPFLIKPFDSDDALRKAFDEQLWKALACIEGAFAVLKSRWRILKCMNVHLMHAPQIAVACCVLHNICQVWGEPEPQQQHVETHPNNHSQGSLSRSENDDTAKLAGEAVREAVFRQWVKNGLDNTYSTFGHENAHTGQN